MAFTMRDSVGDNTIKPRYVHSPITIEHNGIHASIKENGKIELKGKPEVNPDSKEVEYDEIEIPASLVFKLSRLLKDTRKMVYDLPDGTQRVVAAGNSED